MCDHDHRERVLVIRRAGRATAELWICTDCGDYIGTRPTSVRQFLAENPAPCVEVQNGDALAGIDADELRGGPRAHGLPGEDDKVNALLSTMRTL